MEKRKDKKIEITGILILSLSFLVLLSLIFYNPAEEPSISPHVAIKNSMGIAGIYVAHWLIKYGIGYISFIFPVLGFVWGWAIFSRKSLKPIIKLSLYSLGFSLIASMSLGLSAVISENGGYLYSGLTGGLLAKFFHDFLGTAGFILFLLAGALVLIRGYFNLNYYGPFEKMFLKWSKYREQKSLINQDVKQDSEKRKHTQNLLKKLKDKQESAKQFLSSTSGLEEVETTQESGQQEKILSGEQGEGTKEESEGGQEALPFDSSDDLGDMQNIPETGKEEDIDADESEFTIESEVVEEEVNLDETIEKTPRREYQLPSVELLDMPNEGIKISTTHEELVEKANFLVQSLQTFGVEGKVVNISPGPVITLFEVEPAEGVRVNKFVQLSDDLARVMMAKRVRIVAPIPGKSTVGVEIPNKQPLTVHLRSVVNSDKYVNSESKLTIALGKTTNGENYTIEINQLPHLLIAGTTGSGKSVCVNTIINSILLRATPKDVRFIMIDPKKLELACYAPIQKHHLITSEDISEFVVTTPENAVLALRSAEQEMGRRYDILASAVVRNIEEYQQKAEKDSELEPMPYIVVIIDELADLMLRAPKEVETPITRLAQMARAVGIHLVVATQRPSVNVITGVIKANFPARIAFQVATKIDSRTILDVNGAEKLLGKGDMLFLPPGSSDPIRLHNSFVGLDEINRIVEHITDQPESDEIVLEGSRVKINEDDPFSTSMGSQDELFNEAARLVITHQQGSISLLQRRLRIGYSRAARLIDEMEQAGIVGAFTGSKAREVLVDELYLEGLDDVPPDQ
tara:strand:- start:5372 stop:7777 length:2406 start_codon:yes stop_codon:yes gene_type:complete